MAIKPQRMTNDNTPPPNKVVAFKRNKNKVEHKEELADMETFASIRAEGGLVCVSIKDGEIGLTPRCAVEMCVALIAAMRVAVQQLKE